MSAGLPSASELDPATLEPILTDLAAGDLKGCCAAVYEHPAVRWLLGGELHPGGAGLTRRTIEGLGLQPRMRLVDVASGDGASAILAARESGCEVVGVDYGAGAVEGARAAAEEASVGDRVRFVVGDAEALPFEDASFDAALCECALCTFPDKPTAVAEIARVLRPGGRVAISDMVANHERLSPEMRSSMATVACVGQALDRPGYERLLAGAGFELESIIDAAGEVEAMTEGVKGRLRGARILGFEELMPIEGGLREAIRLCDEGIDAARAGDLSYSAFIARRA